MCLRPKRIVGGLVLLGLTRVASATPSGLSNIPTTGTTPQGTYVLQAFGTVGGEADDDFNLGFKTANTTSSSTDANRAGETFGYLVVSRDLCYLRGHVGCGLQGEALLPFLGFDKTFTKGTFRMKGEERDLFTLRTDMIQRQDLSRLYSAGVLVPVIDPSSWRLGQIFPTTGMMPR